MSRLWFPALPDTSGKSSKSAKEETLPPALPATVENWMAMFNPWIPRVDANVEPFMEATRVSMRVFMPWHNNPFHKIEALAGGKLPGKAIAPDSSPAELEVTNALTRSRTQD
ncbi:MAG: hypothetical protein FWH15_09730 [Betaproteobacteria bacterium]|nr:hypothetical protein [Betaproteobacteria bacterium]